MRLFGWFWTRLDAHLVDTLTPIITAQARVAGTAAAEAVAELVPALKEANALAVLREARFMEKLDKVELAVVARRIEDEQRHRALVTAYDEIGARQDRMLAALDAAAGRISAAVQGQTTAALDRVFSHQANFWGSRLAHWAQGPVGEAVRYAVEKVNADVNLVDPALCRAEALQWTKHWLKEYAPDLEIPEDARLNFLIEAAVLEAKGAFTP